MKLNYLYIFAMISLMVVFGCGSKQTKPTTKKRSKTKTTAKAKSSSGKKANVRKRIKSSKRKSLNQQVLLELNRARTNPKKYARKLKVLLKYYKGKRFKRPGEITILTQEGKSAVKEAIRFLERTSAIGPLKMSRGMSLAALDHVKDQAPSGRTGHTGRDGSDPFKRMARYGKWQYTAGENIDYGSNKADRIVMSLIIDDGVPGRGHRKNI